MTALKDILIRRIRQTGPITLADYMAECLLHPEHGYYTTRDPLGATGDFTTAPEISQMFGELLGLALAQSWLDQGAPDSFILAELGPGRGTLMADILRATRAVKGFHEACNVHLVEASPILRNAQRAAMPDREITWCDQITDLPDAPLWLVANEFFDALPIRQFTRKGGGWAETQVGFKDDALALGLSAASPLSDLRHRLADTTDGNIVELCPAAAPITDEIATRIATHGGAAIIVDYGDWHSLGDTFQALEAHEMVDPLARPGQADLTAHVDFEPIAIAAIRTGAAASKMIEQGHLLARLGIQQRAERLAERLDGKALESHIRAFERLTSPTEMGTLFKAVAIAPAPHLLPPGFDA
ncbi:class I SAM-dependent methyltransferase [Celeribacter litoreus]|uniref:class I SAM-dependent methyltransferase n=1 Tax=Celeribacter litoreus TaxID=2876714 RepID=UPI001CCF0004|nr:SAM-dependent methyltransferase [Celeribacter litoreus]MCA0042791.1 SAM-dependent methyltransferase [Celeribacter litoreus]